MSKNKYNPIVALLFGALVFSCQRQDEPTLDNEEKTVDVALSIGFDSEVDGYELTKTTKGGSDKDAAFDFELVPSATRANTKVPDKLYNLEIRQYDANGNYKAGMHFNSGDGDKEVNARQIGESLNISLTDLDNCQIVIVAWGSNVKESDVSLGTKNLSEAMDVTYPEDLLGAAANDPNASMNGMPYVLHLKGVNVKGGYIQSGSGEIDARLKLKRMAALMTFNWDYNVPEYNLQQIVLQSIPLNFRVIPNPDKDGNYPSLIDQFTTIQLTSDQIAKKSYSRWIPANVRGNSSTASSITNRYKATAPQGSVFANFVAVNQSEVKKKLDYRVYVGGNDVTNFDVLPNTNYTYQVNFAHTGIPVNDKRVTYIDPIPASQNNNNFVPTANCFMVAPGGSFNFVPTKMRVNGNDVANPYLTSVDPKYWGEIKTVKLLWQTKEDGDVGDPVVGIVNSASDHSNIVEYKSGRIYCRVAANTSGGSGVIAAYDASGEILWSWHVWVTDYNPSATAKETVLTPDNARIQKYGTTANLFMDRNLGAVKGFVTKPAEGLEMSKGNGFHYQRARKDPFPSSYTTKNSLGDFYIFEIQPNKPPKHILNRYGADGLTLITPSSGAEYTIRNAYQNPINLADRGVVNGVDWGKDPLSERLDWRVPKSVNDPCPVGWRVPTKDEVLPLESASPSVNQGYRMIQYDGVNSTFFRFTGYPPNITQLNAVGQTGYLMTSTRSGSDSQGYVISISRAGVSSGLKHSYDAHTLRCIQEK